jgi:outer membrane protein assembly factor BamB
MRARRSAAHTLLRFFVAWLLLFPAPIAQGEEVSTVTAVADATLKQGAPSSNDGTTTGLLTHDNQRTLVQFSLGIPADSAIKTSFLKMKLVNAPGASRTQDIHRVTGTTAWTEGGVTWNKRDGVTNWTTAGGDYNSGTAASQASGTTNNTVLTWTILGDSGASNIPQGWLTGSVDNRGLLIKDASEPGGGPPPDPPWWDSNYGYRKQITVSAGSTAIANGYPVRMQFDHASLVPAKSQADGDDIRIAYWNGSGWTELSRVLENGSAWNNAATKVFFKTNASIAASGSDNGYFLYYGYGSAVSPPTTGVASARYYLAESLAETTRTSGTYASIVQLQFTPGATTEHWVVVCTWRQRRVLVDATADFFAGRAQVRLNGSTRTGTDNLSFRMASGIWKTMAAVFKITGTTAQQTVNIDFASYNGVDNSGIDNARIVAFLIPDASSANIQYAEDLPQTTTSGAGNITIQTVTFTPSSAGDYIWMANAFTHEAPGGASSTLEFLDEAGAVQQATDETYISTTETGMIPITHFERRNLTATSKSFIIRINPDDTTGSHRQGLTQLLFRADVFDTVEVGSSAGLSNPNPAPTTYAAAPNPKVTLTTASVGSAQDYVYLAVMNKDSTGTDRTLSEFGEISLAGVQQLEDEVAINRASYNHQIAWGYAETGTGNKSIAANFKSESSAFVVDTQFAHILSLRYKEPGSSLGTEEPFSAGGSVAWWNGNYQCRQKLSITAGSAAVPSGYTVPLTFNHAGLVSSCGALASGDDLRVVRWTGSSWVELDRVKDPDPAITWNSASTKIWLKTQASISASSSDTSYYLYYGYSGATSPPANALNVFFFYDGFESGDYSAWYGTLTNDAGDSITTNTTTVHTGTYSSRSIVGAPTPGSAAAERRFTAQTGLHTTVWVRVADWDAVNDVSMVQYYGGVWGTQQGSLSLRADTGCGVTRTVFIWNNAGAEAYCGTTQLALNTWYRLEMKMRRVTNGCSPSCNGRAELWVNGVREVNESGRNTGSADFEQNLVGIFWKSTGVQTLYTDNSFDRIWVDPEPSSAFSGGEERAAPRYGAREQGADADRPKLELRYLRNVSLGSISPGTSEITLNWTFPAGSTSANYDGVLAVRKPGASAPTFAPSDGTSHTVGQDLGGGESVAAWTTSFSTVSFVEENGPDSIILPGTQYTYKLFTRDNNTITGAATPSPPHYALGVAPSSVTTTTGGGTAKNWSYNTGVVALMSPGLVAGGTVVVGDNNGKVHAMNSTDGARRYRPEGSTGITGGAIPSRPPVIPTAYTSHPCACDVAYVGAGDGKVYAFNATTGAQVWPAPATVTTTGTIQGAPAVQVRFFSNASFQSTYGFDLVIVGTRNTGDNTTNKIVALNGNTGATVWTFTGGGANPNLDQINSTPMVDLSNNTVWVSSRAGASGTQASLWKLDTLNGSLLQNITLSTLAAADRHIDRSPTLNADKSFVYALTEGGDLVAVEVATNNPYYSSDATGSGVGFPIPVANGGSDDLYFSTTGGAYKRSFDRTLKTFSATVRWDQPTVANPSTPIFVPPPGSMTVFVGSSDGKVHRLNATTGADEAQRVVTTPGTTVGDPSFDTASNKLYVGAGGRIYSFDLYTTGSGSSGTKTWGECGTCDYTGVAQDAYIDQGQTNYNTGAETLLRVGDETGSRADRILIKFNLSALSGLISSSSQIVSAKLKMKTNDQPAGSGSMAVDAFRMKKDWNQGNNPYAPADIGENEVTWSHQYYNGTAWTGAGVSNVADRDLTADGTATISTNRTWYEWDVTNSVKTMFDTGQYYGWLLKWQTEGTANYFRVYSSEQSNSGNRPYLEITFNP